MDAAAANFKIGEADLKKEVEKFRYRNCKHGSLGIKPHLSEPNDMHSDHENEVSKFAEDVLLHVVLHEIDWHSLVKISFENGDGSAAWSRSTRTITVQSEYIRRFIKQGRTAGLSASN